MASAPALDATAFILAGGKSTRMGMDKAFVELNGRTLLARALDLVRSVPLDVRIVGSREKFAHFAPVVEDVFPDRGPLAGIHAALRASNAELNLMLAVNTPFVSSAFLQYLIKQIRSAPGTTVVVPRPEGLWQPLCAIYRREFADAAETALLAGRNRIDSLFAVAAVQTRTLDEDELKSNGFSIAMVRKMFRNLNTLEELKSEERVEEVK